MRTTPTNRFYYIFFPCRNVIKKKDALETVLKCQATRLTSVINISNKLLMNTIINNNNNKEIRKKNKK